MAYTLPQGGLTGAAKLKAVTDLVNMLTQDLSKASMPPQQRDAALEELKAYGRDPRDADPIFTKQGIETLTQHAFHSSSPTTSRNALRCLANAMLIKPAARQMFVDLGFEAKACAKLKSGTFDDEFLVSRILFLTTYGTSISLRTLIDRHHLADVITQNLVRHAKQLSGKAKPDPMADNALAETAKLLFNVTHFCPERVDAFTPAIGPIVTLVCKHSIPAAGPLDAPLGSVVNALLTLDLSSKAGSAAIFSGSSSGSGSSSSGSGSAPSALAERLIYLLKLALAKYGDNELDQVVLPLLTALRKLYELAPVDTVRPVMRAKLLPSDADRKDVLGRGDSLSAKLLRHTTNALAPEFRASAAHLLFELSDKDASRFVQNVGYGFASGYLFQNNVPLPEGVAQAIQRGGAGDRDVNAVTGQFLDAESGPSLPDMTDEEKEREAERLFVLFERLRKTGVVDIENPVAQALRQGRLDKIDDKDRVEELE